MGGSSKKVTVGYRIYLGMHMILCHGPVDSLVEIKVDSRLAWAGRMKHGRLTVDKPSLFGGDSREGGISGLVDFEAGGSTQGVNDYLADKIGPLIPAFRGVVGVVLRQVYVGLNPYLKKWSFRMKRIHMRQNGLKQWYDTKAEIGGDELRADAEDFIITYSGGTLSTIDYNGSEWIAAGNGTSVLRSTDNGATWQTISTGFGNFTSELAYNGSTVAHVAGSDFNIIKMSHDGGSSFENRSIPSIEPGSVRMYHVAYGGGLWMAAGSYASWQGYVTVSADGGDTWSPVPGSGQNYVSGDPVVDLCYLSGSTWLAVDYTGRVHISTSGGAFWEPTEKLFVNRLRNLPQGLYAIHSSGSIGRSFDEGSTWQSSVALPFVPQDITNLSDFLLVVGSGGQAAVSYDLGATWEVIPQILGGGANLISVKSNGEDMAYAVGSGGTIVRIHITHSRKGDMNPAHIIRECLTDPDWGMGYPEGDIDETSFIAAADQLFAEKMGMSLLWDRQISIEDFIAEVIKHINGVLYVDRTTGKFALRLIRDDYAEADLPLLDENDIESVEGYGRPSIGELINSITVNYWDSDTGNTGSITVDDPALIQVQGAVISAPRQYPGFTNADIATRAAQSDLRAFSTPLLSCTLYARNSKAGKFNIGDCFKFAWPDLHDGYIVMRITGLALGDGRNNKVRVTCTEDVFAIPDVAMVSPSSPGWEDPSVAPGLAQYRILVEAPYYELVQRIGQTQTDTLLNGNPDVGYILASAAQPVGAINAALMVDAGAGYEDSGSVEFSPFGLLGVAIGITDTTVTLVDESGISGIRIGSHVQIDDELLRVDAVSGATLTVARGILDTVPSAHADGALLIGWDDYADGDNTEYASGESVNVKLLPMSGGGGVALSEATADTLLLQGRAARPYRPGNVMANGAYEFGPTDEITYPIDVTWAHRNRLQETGENFVGYYEGSVTPEPGVTYTLRVVEINMDGSEGATLHTETGLTGESWSLALSVIELSSAPAFRIGIRAVRDVLNSLSESRVIIPGISLLAPTSLTAVVEVY